MSQTVKELHQKRMKLWNASIESHRRYINKKPGSLRINSLSSEIARYAARMITELFFPKRAEPMLNVWTAA